MSNVTAEKMCSIQKRPKITIENKVCPPIQIIIVCNSMTIFIYNGYIPSNLWQEKL
jgi:hypothetical protein